MTVLAPHILSDTEAITYIAQNAPAKGLDAAAVLSIANGEGIGMNHGVGDTNAGGFGSYGPFQLNGSGGALPANVKAQGQAYAQAWAWSTDGIDYALNQIAGVAGGLAGWKAINAISTGFERSGNQPQATTNAWAIYDNWVKAIQGIIPGVSTPSTAINDPGTTTTPAPAATPVQTGIASAIGSTLQGLLGPGWNLLEIAGWKPDASGITLLLASLFAILIGALIWRGDDVKGAVKQAPAAALL